MHMIVEHVNDHRLMIQILKHKDSTVQLYAVCACSYHEKDSEGFISQKKLGGDHHLDLWIISL